MSNGARAVVRAPMSPRKYEKNKNFFQKPLQNA
jgi:hypothetical protein